MRRPAPAFAPATARRALAACCLAVLLAVVAAPPAHSTLPADPIDRRADRPSLPGGSAAVPDPAGGRPWAVGTSRLAPRPPVKGGMCAKVVRGGRIAAAACWRMPGTATTEVATRVVGERTIVFGVAAPDVAAVELVGNHSRRVVLTRRGRAFAVVLAGRLETRELPVRVTLRDGTVRLDDRGAGTIVEARDPFAAGRWALSVGLPGPAASCPTWSAPGDVLPDLGARRFSRGECFDLVAAPLGVARVRVGGRVLLLGLAGPRVRSVALARAGAPQRLELSARGRGFLAVLATGDDPVLVAELEDGTTVTVPGELAHTGTVEISA